MACILERAGIAEAIFRAVHVWAGRLRGGKGVFGWVKALPWGHPMMLAVTFSFVMLGFGGAGGLINMSYQLNETIHNTQWVTGHFHLIFGGTVVMDANDIGRNVLGSDVPGDKARFEEMFADNPLGQGSEQTPMALVFLQD